MGILNAPPRIQVKQTYVTCTLNPRPEAVGCCWASDLAAQALDRAAAVHAARRTAAIPLIYASPKHRAKEGRRSLR